ncbi:hypothetical protein ACFQ4K_22065 [Tistrella bauzanensis]
MHSPDPSTARPLKPRLAARIVEDAGGLSLDRGDSRFILAPEGIDARALGQVLRLIDGGAGTADLVRAAEAPSARASAG